MNGNSSTAVVENSLFSLHCDSSSYHHPEEEHHNHHHHNSYMLGWIDLINSFCMSVALKILFQQEIPKEERWRFFRAVGPYLGSWWIAQLILMIQTSLPEPVQDLLKGQALEYALLSVSVPGVLLTAAGAFKYARVPMGSVAATEDLSFSEASPQGRPVPSRCRGGEGESDEDPSMLIGIEIEFTS
ncbi:expressed unknown protein [Seminavis robusta]|uniref:Uncharacterized protein n=1 Tax=Seminavis robusta TaxID=568900 RepID=A0A9N8EUF8_9STRA|nr:expressed unknown protein [Seminavis robusta]|eukprot:Sro1655_g288950.1 n/a (186) ;mRNA; f:8383-8940